MRTALCILLLMMPALTEAAEPTYRRAPRPLDIRRPAATMPYLGPYACSAAQLRNRCYNWYNSSRIFAVSDGIATCVCSKMP